MTEVWLGQMRAGPSVGTFSRPSTWNRQPNRKRGVMTALATG